MNRTRSPSTNKPYGLARVAHGVGVCPGRRTMRAVIDGIIQSRCGSVDPGRCSPMRS